MSNPSLLSFPAIVIYVNSIGQALLFALFIPTLSLYVAERFNANAFWVGTFFVGTASTGIIYSHILGRLSDRMQDRRWLIAIGMFGGGLASALLAYAPSYALALIVGLSLFSLAFSSIAQIFAHARDYSDTHLNRKQSVMFNSTVRACAAFAWVGGPPIGFILLGYIGFKALYLAIAVLYLMGALTALISLPRVTRAKQEAPVEHANKGRTIVFAMCAFSLLYACNQSYLIALPLYLSQDLGVDSEWAGWIMGTAAALEIPVMIFAGWLGSRFSLPPLIRIGAIAPIALYVGFWQADSVWQLFPLQILNAMMIGFIAGLGMTWFQDLMPGKAGAASALYWNSTNIGNILGAASIAVFAQMFGYRDMYVVNAIMACIACGFLFAIGGNKSKLES
ncbi:MAG: SET family sugar efflux transporter-like MFS transporter [Flavobacteriales bacterium]|jgi:SET family sugar efflux transporter-like MFS transporter